MKKQAKKFEGTIVKTISNLTNTTIEYVGITRKFEDFKKEAEIWNDKCEIFKENVILYKVDLKNADGNLANLCEIRNNWARGRFNYRDFYTKEQIKVLLENDFCVAVQGLQEIDLEDLDKLEDSNLDVEWKYLDITNWNDYMKFQTSHNYEVGPDGFYID